jgi:hypothetical protein
MEALLDATKEGTGELVAITNKFNELLYDEIIPRLFRLLFELDEYEVDLIKMPSNGYYEVSATKGKLSGCTTRRSRTTIAPRASTSTPTALTPAPRIGCSGICCASSG